MQNQRRKKAKTEDSFEARFHLAVQKRCSKLYGDSIPKQVFDRIAAEWPILQDENWMLLFEGLTVIADISRENGCCFSIQAGIYYEQLWEAACGKRLAKDPLPRSASFLRFAAAFKRCSHEADTGLAWSQRLLDDGEYLLASGVQLKINFRRRLGAESRALTHSNRIFHPFLPVLS